MARSYGIFPRDGHSRFGHMIMRVPVSVLTTGEKTPRPDLIFAIGDLIGDAIVRVYTLEATAGTKTIDVGLTGTAPDDDADGFIVAGVTSAVGSVRGGVTVTTGSNTKFYAATPTRGVLLCDHQAGTDVDQDEGLYVEKPHAITQADAVLTYTLGSAHTELDADIEVLFYRPHPAN